MIVLVFCLLIILFADVAARPSASVITPEYQTWLKRSGVEFVDVSVEAASKSSGGLKQKGLFALKSIPEEGFVFLKVALKGAIVNIEHAVVDELFTKYFTQEALDALNDPTVMSAFVAFCKITHHSLWAPHFSSLPLEFTTPLYFPSFAELQASEVADLAKERLEQVAREYDALPTELKKIVSPPLFQWAYTVLLSRSFGLQVKDAQGKWQAAACLVPGADFLNSGVRTNADCGTNEASTHFQCFTTAPVGKGEEMLVPYGAFINEQKLLLDYGFILATNFTARVILDPKWEPTNTHKPMLGSVLRVTENGFRIVKQAALKGLQGANESLVCKFLINRLQLHLSAYSTTIEQDQEILNLPPSWNFDSSCRGCFHTVVRLRLGEKKVYRALLHDADGWLQELKHTLVKNEL